MRILIFLSLFFILGIPSFGQNVLELKNTSTGKSRIIKPGARVYFKSIHDSSFIKGKIVQIKDTSVVFYSTDFSEEDPLLDLRLSEISAIKKPTGFHAAYKSVGSVLLPIGTFLFVRSGLTLLRDSEYQGQKTYDVDVTNALFYSGAGMIIVGTIPFLMKPKVYDFKKGWTLSIKK